MSHILIRIFCIFAYFVFCLPRLCDRKQWHTSRLIMGLPQGQKAKDNVILRSYAGSTKTQAILDWVNYNLASRIRYVVFLICGLNIHGKPVFVPIFFLVIFKLPQRTKIYLLDQGKSLKFVTPLISNFFPF